MNLSVIFFILFVITAVLLLCSAKRFATIREKLETEITERREAEEKIKYLAKFPDENPNPVLRVSSEGDILYTNQSCSALLRIWNCKQGFKIPETVCRQLKDCLASSTDNYFEIQISGRIFMFAVSLVSGTDSIYLYGQDITEHRSYEKELQLLASVFENTMEGISITNSKGIIEKVNPAFTAITGYGPEEVIGQTHRILKSDQHDIDFYKQLWDSLIKTGCWSGEIWNRRKNGESFPERLYITAIRNNQGEAVQYVSVFHDITDLKLTEEQLKYQAYHDALTGLPNRYLFKDRLEMMLAHAYRYGEIIAVMNLDLDKFKNINDSLGHDAGDILLQDVSKRLKICCRKIDTVARLGGDEFIVILPNMKNSGQNAVEIAQRFIKCLSEPFHLKGQEIYITASIGITLYPHDGQDVTTLVKNADIAMYRAKEKGRNKFEMYTAAMNSEILRQITLESSLRTALDQNELKVFYQPKIDIKKGLISGTEALTRWQRTETDMVPPDEFIPVAEDTGIIFPLGEWVLRTACMQTKLWQDAGYPLSVAVNLSARQFQDEHLDVLIRDILKETGLDSESLTLEITENIVMMDVDVAAGAMKKLSEMGISISIDDFGTGYSSLNYLKQFPLKELKIDKSFIKDIPGHSDDMAIVKAIISLASSLGLKVVAEGVETEDQLEFVCTHGCNVIQGYLFSRPKPDDEIYSILKEGKNFVSSRFGNLEI